MWAGANPPARKSPTASRPSPNLLRAAFLFPLRRRLELVIGLLAVLIVPLPDFGCPNDNAAAGPRPLFFWGPRHRSLFGSQAAGEGPIVFRAIFFLFLPIFHP